MSQLAALNYAILLLFRVCVCAMMISIVVSKGDIGYDRNEQGVDVTDSDGVNTMELFRGGTPYARDDSHLAV